MLISTAVRSYLHYQFNYIGLAWTIKHGISLKKQKSDHKVTSKTCAYHVKVGFFQKVLAKFSNFSKCHSCEPKIVPELLIPVNNNNKILVILWIDQVIKSPHYKKCKLYGLV